MRYPLVVLALVFAFGIYIGYLFKSAFPLLFFIDLAFICFSFLPLPKIFRNIILCCSVFLFGAVTLQNSRILPANHISKYVFYKSKNSLTIKGFVESQPSIVHNRISFIFQAKEIQFSGKKYYSCGKTLVRLASKADLAFGEELIVKGHLYRLFNFDKNSSSYRDYLNRQGIYTVYYVLPKSGIVKLNNNQGSFLRKFSLRLKDKLEKIIFRDTSFICAAVLDAMVLGEKSNIPQSIYNAMIKSGTVHILVVSGFNVGIVAFLIMLLLKICRIPRKIRILIAMVLLVIYCFLTGTSNPVVRATVMGIVFLAAYFIKRDPDIYNSCAMAAVFILINNPNQLFDIGFQLSFLSVVSIIYLYPKIKSILPIESIQVKPLRFILEGLLVSFSAWIGTMGLILYYFRIFSPVTAVANLFIVPLATLITLCGFSLICAGVISPLLAHFFAPATEILVALLLKLNFFLIGLPGAYLKLS